MMTAALIRLAVHYYRPDFTEAMAKSLIGDMVQDLSWFEFPEVDMAIRAYRTNAKNRFFPTSGQLIELAQAERKDRVEREKFSTGKVGKPEFGESRPYYWWCMRKRDWAPHWRLDDLNEEQKAGYDRWLACVKAGKVKGKSPDDY